MSSDLSSMGAREIAGAVRARRVSALAVAETALARVAALNPRLNAYRLVLSERALGEAAAVDAALAEGRDPGPLAGVPYGVKDLFDVAGLATAAGSAINLSLPHAARDAVLIERLRAAGAVLLGVQVMDEYAYGFTTENAHYGNVRNPRDLERSAGGSSGGSGAAVAAGLGVFALGSDTNGSIRVPASFCGIFGLKPTFGRLPRTGSFPFVFDLDHLGPFARSAGDLALVYEAMKGWDRDDPACVADPPEPAPSDRPLRVAQLGGWFHDMAGAQARDAAGAVAEALGARDRVELQSAEAVRSAAFLITAASGANLHRTNLRVRPGDFDPAVRGRLLAGALLPADAILQAQRLRRAAYDEAMTLFAHYDLLVAPATPIPAPRLGETESEIGGRLMPTRPNIGVLTQPISAIGLPAVAAPILAAGALPIGVQLIAPPWREDLALKAAATLEAAGLARAPIAEP